MPLVFAAKFRELRVRGRAIEFMPKQEAPIKFDYYDDEDIRTIRAFINAVQADRSDLQIELRYPLPFEKFIAQLKRTAFDGLILDLRLDQKVNVEGEKANFRATSFAQELRNLATEQTLSDFPIVLWSMDDRLKQTYLPDNTGHDLFDLKCVKNDIEDNETLAQDIADKMISLALGYRELRSITGERRKSNQARIRLALNLGESDEFLDLRILNYFEGVKGRIPPHEFARFVLKSLLEFPGPLIDEDILAARLGVSLENSAPEDWIFLKQRLRPASYTGIFNNGWQRWWTYLIENWWATATNSSVGLRSLSARERVERLKKVIKRKGLVAAEPINETYSTNFWTICQATKRPLSPKDGFTLQNTKDKPWSDRLYISIDLALSGTLKNNTLRISGNNIKDKRLQREGVTVDSHELERLKTARKNSQSEQSSRNSFSPRKGR